MPELPELEVFAANLEKHFKDKILERLEVSHAKKLNYYKQDLQQYLEGQRLHNVTRDGKTLVMHFRRGRVLALHLMVSGKLELLAPDGRVEHQIIAFYFNNGSGFALTDPQKQAMVTPDTKLSDIPDALSADLNPAYFLNVLERESITIKQLLTNQQVVRGISNTYADEILWQAGISPFSIAKAIPKHKAQLLHQSIQEVFAADITKFRDVANGGFSGTISAYHNIHNPDKVFSPTGGKILVDSSAPLKTYYTDEQELFGGN